jgi:hypothetical protein
MKLPGLLVKEMHSAYNIANFRNGSPCILCDREMLPFENINQLGLNDMVLCLEQARQSITAKDGGPFVQIAAHISELFTF